MVFASSNVQFPYSSLSVVLLSHFWISSTELIFFLGYSSAQSTWGEFFLFLYLPPEFLPTWSETGLVFLMNSNLRLLFYAVCTFSMTYKLVWRRGGGRTQGRWGAVFVRIQTSAITSEVLSVYSRIHSPMGKSLLRSSMLSWRLHCYLKT